MKENLVGKRLIVRMEIERIEEQIKNLYRRVEELTNH